MFFSINSLKSQSVFEKLPFNIIVGVTTGEEIEDRGTCLKKIKVRDEYFRCEKYNIADRFLAFASQNEVVNKISFYADFNHSFPRSWREEGIVLSKAKIQEGDRDFYGSVRDILLTDKGVNINNFISILERDDIEYDRKEFPIVYGDPYGGEIFYRSRIVFLVGSHEFEAFFIDEYNWRKDKFDRFKNKNLGYTYDGENYDYMRKGAILRHLISDSGDALQVLNEYYSKTEIGLVELNVIESY